MYSLFSIRIIIVCVYRSIKNLREEITNVRKRNSEIEAEIQEQKALLHCSEILKEMEELKQQAKVLVPIT